MTTTRIRYPLFFIALLCFQAHAEDLPPAIVQVDTALNLQMNPSARVPGTVISRFDSKIAAEVTGNLTRIAQIGDQVMAGEVIAEIDDAAYRLAVEEIVAETASIGVLIDFYQRESERLQVLAKKNNVAKNSLDDIVTRKDEALANLKAAQAQLAIRKDNLKKTKIHAPFSGVIAQKYKDIGEHANAGEQLMRLVNLDELEVEARIKRQSFNHLHINDEVRMNDAASQFNGILRAVLPVGDDRSRLHEIRIVFDNEAWQVGQAVEVVVPIEKKQQVTAVPRDALVVRQNGTIVYRINANDIAEIVPVKIGIANMTHIQVIGDIHVGDKIVIRGNERLRPGQAVQIIDS